jgi:hypothetical protein
MALVVWLCDFDKADTLSSSARNEIVHMTTASANIRKPDEKLLRKRVRLSEGKPGRGHPAPWQSTQAAMVLCASIRQLRKRLDAYAHDGQPIL